MYSLNKNPGECSSVQRKSKTKKVEILVDSEVRRSLRIIKISKGFKAIPVPGKIARLVTVNHMFFHHRSLKT